MAFASASAPQEPSTDSSPAASPEALQSRLKERWSHSYTPLFQADMVYVIDEHGAMGTNKKKVDSFYKTYETEMSLVCDTKGGDTTSKIVKELDALKLELERRERAASPEMAIRQEKHSPNETETEPSKPPEHWSCFDKCFSWCFYGCFLPDTF